METQVFQTNPRLRGLLLILIFTFAASGIVLAILSQIQAYHREQVYLATEAALPAHKIQQLANQLTSESEIVSWKTYRNEEYGFEFRYSSSLDLLDEWENPFDKTYFMVSIGFEPPPRVEGEFYYPPVPFFMVTVAEDNVSPKELLKNNLYDYQKESDIKEIQFLGKPAVELIGVDTSSSFYKLLATLYQGKVYLISSTQEADNILSTFKFIPTP